LPGANTGKKIKIKKLLEWAKQKTAQIWLKIGKKRAFSKLAELRLNPEGRDFLKPS
jgi:hypothetical protein